MNGIDRLVTLVPPPPDPVSATGDWADVEQALGTALPSDYRRLVQTYGSGQLCDHLVWFDPFSDDPPMAAEVEEFLDHYEAHLRENFPAECPWPAHPAEGGLLPWAHGADGEVLCWLTEGPPGRWPVVALDLALVPLGDGPRASVHPAGAVEFLVAWTEGNLRASAITAWPHLEPGVEAFFRPCAGGPDA